MFDVPEEQRKVLGVWKQSEHRINLVSEKWPNTIRKPNNDRERKNEEITFQNKPNGDSKEMVIQELAMLQRQQQNSVKLLAVQHFWEVEGFSLLGTFRSEGDNQSSIGQAMQDQTSPLHL